jgi:tetratricopeptide (TPR) repeat protein
VKAPSVHDQKIEGLRQTLSWLAEDNPAQMFEIMRTSVDLVSGLRPGDIECILARAAPRLTLGHPYRGWELFWRAFSTETDWKGLNPGELHHMALQRALATKDEALASISVLCLGLILVARGKTKQATGIATNTLDFLSTKTKAQYRKRVSLVLGMGQIHSGRVREGITILESVSGCPDISSLEVAYDESNRAFYLASVGRNEHALEALEEPLRIARETQHYYLNQMNSFALAVAMLKSDPKSSAALMKRCIAESPCYGWEPISHETLAAAQHQLGDFDTARSELAAANRMRKARNLPYTEIDRIRLRPLAPYFSTIETTRVARPSPASRTPATL